MFGELARGFRSSFLLIGVETSGRSGSKIIYSGASAVSFFIKLFLRRPGAFKRMQANRFALNLRFRFGWFQPVQTDSSFSFFFGKLAVFEFQLLVPYISQSKVSSF